MAALGVSLSSIGLSAARGIQLIALRDQVEGSVPRGQAAAETTPEATEGKGSAASTAGIRAGRTAELTPEQRREVAELARIDQQVRAHEAAHLRAGAGVVTSGPQFSYRYGPDGKQYAIAGEVGIDTSPEQEPEDNIDKGQRIQVAALAPADPSPQDYRIAAIGGRIEQMGYSGLAAQEARARAEQAAARRDREVEAGGAIDSSDRTRASLEKSYPASETAQGSGLSLFA